LDTVLQPVVLAEVLVEGDKEGVRVPEGVMEVEGVPVVQATSVTVPERVTEGLLLTVMAPLAEALVLAQGDTV